MRLGRYALGVVLVGIALATPARSAVEIATLDTPGSVRDVALDGTIAYLADAGGGVRVLDVSNPAAPVEIASLPPVQLGNVQALYLDGDRLYTAESSGGVSVIDVATPASPVRLGRVTGMSQVLDVVAAGDTAFAISNVGPGFHVIDASDPAAPIVATSLGATGDVLRWITPTRLLAGRRIIDVSDPPNPWIVAENVTYPAGIGDGFGVDTALRRYDLSDPMNPVRVNHQIADDGFYTGIAVDAELAWLIGTSVTGLALSDVSDAEPTYPQTGAIPLTGLAVNRLRIVGTRLYAAVSGTGATGLYVFDVSDPAAPLQLGHFAAGDFTDVDVEGDVAYAVDPSDVDDGVEGVYAIDVSNPALMGEIAFLPMESPGRLAASGSRVYVSDDPPGATPSRMRVFDFSLPWAPADLGWTAGVGGTEIEASGTRLYAVSSQWFRVYDATAPNAITQLGYYWSGGVKRGLAVDGTRAWVTSDQIELIDFSLPFAPTDVAHFDLPGTDFTNPVWVGSRLHVHASGAQILTLDVSDLTDLRVVGTSRLPTSSGFLTTNYAAASGDAVFFTLSGQIVTFDTAGESGLGPRRVATFPSITGTTLTLDLARDLAFVTDGVLRVVDVAPDRALAECVNGRDDDGDGLVDHAEDPECRDGHDKSERADCGNGADDDGDGAVDLADAGCSNGAEASEAPNCDDGIDDDGDGFTDFGADPGCSGWRSDLEDARCQNGIDDDGDGKIDFDGGASVNGGVPLGPADPNCGVASRPTEAPNACGLGAELALGALSLGLLRRRAGIRPGVRRS